MCASSAYRTERGHRSLERAGWKERAASLLVTWGFVTPSGSSGGGRELREAEQKSRILRALRTAAAEEAEALAFLVDAAMVREAWQTVKTGFKGAQGYSLFQELLAELLAGGEVQGSLGWLPDRAKIPPKTRI